MNRFKPASALLGLILPAVFCTAILPVSAITESDAAFDTCVSILRRSDRSLLASASAGSPAALRADEAAAGILIRDAISYRELAPDSEGYYMVTMTLNRADSSGVTPVLSGDPVRLSAASGAGTWTMELSADALPAGTYAVYERAAMYRLNAEGTYARDPEFDAAHEDPNDPLQTIIISGGSAPAITTSIHADMQAGTPQEPVRLSAEEADGISVMDVIRAEGIDPSLPYTVRSGLQDLTSPQDSLQFADYETAELDWDASAGTAVTMQLRMGSGLLHLKPGHRYEACISILSEGAVIASHCDEGDLAERIEVEDAPETPGSTPEPSPLPTPPAAPVPAPSPQPGQPMPDIPYTVPDTADR